MDETFFSILADAVLLIHFAYVAFVVLGLVYVWVGYFAGWRAVRSFAFRLGHLIAMAVVVLESLLGWTCPLTTWEHELRLLAGGGERYGEESFMQHWIHEIMFFDCAPATFTIVYIVFFAALVLSVIVVPPRRPFAKRRDAAPA